MATSPSHRIGNLRILTVSVASLLVSFTEVCGQAISISGVSTYTQNFDSLPPAVGTYWTNNLTLPGWYARTDALASPTLPLGIYNGGRAAVSGFLSSGNSATTERALGARPATSSYGRVLMGAFFQNTSGSALTVGDIADHGELWFPQSTENNLDGFQFFYQVASSPITTLAPFTINNAATYATNAAIADAGWIRFVSLDSDLNAAAGVALATPIVKNIKSSLGITLQANEYMMLHWRNPNDTSAEAVMGIDDFSVSFAAPAKIYNLNHTVGGAPNGVLAVSPNPYWLSGAVPAGFANGDSIAFSQDITAGPGTATITVPAAVTLGAITLGNTIGTYTLKTDADVTAARIDGTGTRALRKTGAAALIVTGPSTGSAGLVLDEGSIQLNSTGGSSLAGPISTTFGVLSTGGVTVMGTGAGSASIGGGTGDTTDNTYVGTTTVASGNLLANKAAGATAISGDLVVQAGATFRYAGNTGGNQIADTSSITIDGGSFGDVTATGVNPANPGAAETVTNVTMTAGGGNFSTGRAAFTASGAFRVLAGKALAHRSGSITANQVEVGVTGSIDLDGTSSTAGAHSRLIVGTGGLTLTNGTINLNSHAAIASATSLGSILTLNGDVTSIGASKILDLKTPAMTAAVADVDLGSSICTFDITGVLDFGSKANPVHLTGLGGVRKVGPGTLTLHGVNPYMGETTIESGILALTGFLGSTARVAVKSGATFDIAGVSGGATFDAGQALTGAGTVAGEFRTTGSIAPGDGLGTLHFTAGLALGGRADFEIEKIGVIPRSDLVEAGGALAYGGILNVTSIGQALRAGDTFNLFDAPSFTGAFTALHLPALEAGLAWSTGSLAIDGTIAVVPEPVGALLTLSGMAALLAMRRPRE